MSIRTNLRDAYRKVRVRLALWFGIEPSVPLEIAVSQEFHGSEYGGWSIPARSLRADSLVVDIGLGEDVSFSTSLIERYGCTVHGFDPTPRVVRYVEGLGIPKFNFHRFGVAAKAGTAKFYLPNNELHVSGTLAPTMHTGKRQMEVELITLDGVMDAIGADRIDLLKIDIEGAEYELLMDERFAQHAPRIQMLCIEFHHRWPNHGKTATAAAVERLAKLGFRCSWVNDKTNEEFTFIRTHTH
jgi:FkbM family methyltransferase